MNSKLTSVIVLCCSLFSIVASHGFEQEPKDAPTGPEIWAKLHALFMFLAWGVFISIGIYISRFTKDKYPYGWFRAHFLIGFLAIVCALTGLILILKYMDWTFDWGDPHHLLGLLALLGMAIQPVIGFIANAVFNPTRKQAPVFPDRVHWYIGFSSWIGAVINIGIGLSMQPNWWSPWIFAFYYLFIAFLIGVFVMTTKPKERHGYESKTLIPHVIQ